MTQPVPTYLQRDRAESFGAVAAEYDRQRPSYPPALIDDLVALGGHDVLDVGCGTGKAARLLAARGLNVLGVEIDAEMAAVARTHDLPVEVGSFETWDDAGRRFDLITCAQAWHWIDPEAGLAKAVAVLRPNGAGALVPFWNYATFDPALKAAVDEVYARLEPRLVSPMANRTTRNAELGQWAHDPRVACVETRAYEWEHVYSTEQWLALIQTHSDHLQLPHERRVSLVGALREVIEGCDGEVAAQYTTFATIATVA